VVEDIFICYAEHNFGKAFSLFPTIRHLEQIVVRLWDKGSCGAFHNSTALITTTSFMDSRNYKVLLRL